MSAEEQSDESKHQQKKGWHASHSFQPSTCQSTRYERIEYWRTTRQEPTRAGSYSLLPSPPALQPIRAQGTTPQQQTRICVQPEWFSVSAPVFTVGYSS